MEIAKLAPGPSAPPPPEPVKPQPEARTTPPAAPSEPPKETNPPPSSEASVPDVPERSSRRRRVPVQVAMNDAPGANSGKGKSQGKGKSEGEGKGKGKGDSGDSGPSREQLEVSMSDLGKSGADNGSVDYLPGVKRGEITALNAKEYTYAAFFNQMKKNIRFHWDDRGAIRAMGFDDQTLPRISVVVRMVLNRDGSLASAEVTQSSGYPIWDSAAVKAVRQAAPFYNLPPALLDSEGNFAFSWRFLTY